MCNLLLVPLECTFNPQSDVDVRDGSSTPVVADLHNAMSTGSTQSNRLPVKLLRAQGGTRL